MRQLSIATIIASLTFLAYAETFFYPFQYDDYVFIGNDLFEGLHSLTDLYLFYPARFLNSLSLATSYHLHGPIPVGYRTTSIIGHAINGYLVYLFVFQVARTFTRSSFASTAALVASFVFVTHPIQTESVTYIAQRGLLLMSLFSLVCLNTYWFARESKGVQRVWLYGVSVLALIAALFSKQSAVMIPCVIIALELLRDGRKEARLTVPSLMLLLAAIYGLFVLTAGDPSLKKLATVSTHHHTPIEYFLMQFKAKWTYWRIYFWPQDQSLQHLISKDILGSHEFWLGLSIDLLGIALIVKLWKGHKLIVAGLLFYFLTIALETSVFPLEDIAYEHRFYLPQVGVLLAVAGLLYEARRYANNHRTYDRGVLVVGFVMAVLLAHVAIERNKVWRTPATLWSDVLQKNPASYKARNFLAIEMLQAGELEESESMIRSALDLSPQNAILTTNYGLVLLRAGKLTEARQTLERASRLDTTHPAALINLSDTLSRMGLYSEAEEKARAALSISPRSKLALSSLASAQMLQRNYSACLETANILTRQHPLSSRGYWLTAKCLSESDRKRRALTAVNEALQRQPNHIEGFTLKVSIMKSLGIDTKQTILEKRQELHHACGENSTCRSKVDDTFKVFK